MTFLLTFGCSLPTTAQLTVAGCPRAWTKRESSALLCGYEELNVLIYDPLINGPFTYRPIPAIARMGLENKLLQVRGLFCHL